LTAGFAWTAGTFDAGLTFDFGNGFPAFALTTGFLATSVFFAAGLAAFAFGLAAGFLAFGLAAGFLAFGLAAGFRAFGLAADFRALDLATGCLDFFGAAFLRVGRAGFLALAPAGFRAAGLRAADVRGFALAGDLRAGFAGFLAMVILKIRVLYHPNVAAIGKTSNYIIWLSVPARISRDMGCRGAP
jgi:hypothetical protein